MPRMLFRAAKSSDLESIYKLALNSGPGFTTLPKSKEHLQERLRVSINAFNQSITQPQQEYYLFVLEDLDNHAIVGTSAIESSIGRETPFFTYNVTQQIRHCVELTIQQQDTVLNPIYYVQRKSEVCTLYLDQRYRQSSYGLLLSKARFLFMAQFPERFETAVIAELRGVINENGLSPFWESLGKKLYPMSFAEADALSLTNKEFLANFLPDYPINIRLLTPEAQAVIGQPHPSAQGAMHILAKEGFRPNGWVDVFDAGPTVEARLNTIKTIRYSQCQRIKKIQPSVTATEQYLMASTTIDFRAIVDDLVVESDGVTLSQAAADALQLQVSDDILFAPLTLGKIDNE